MSCFKNLFSTWCISFIMDNVSMKEDYNRLKLFCLLIKCDAAGVLLHHFSNYFGNSRRLYFLGRMDSRYSFLLILCRCFHGPFLDIYKVSVSKINPYVILRTMTSEDKIGFIFQFALSKRLSFAVWRTF